MNKGDVDEGALSDDSGRWVSVKSGRMMFCFSFDMKGEHLEDVGLYEDTYQKVTEKLIFKV